MATTTVLLREDIDNLGGRGEVVSVKAGYARNYLLPQGFAMVATKGNIKQIEQEKEILLKKAAQEKSTADAQLEQMTNLKLNFERKAGESGTLFGSVTSMDVESALQEKGYEIDRRQIILKTPIKEIGEYTIPVKLHREVTLELPVTVSVEGEAIQETLEGDEKVESNEEEKAYDSTNMAVSSEEE